MTESSDRMSAGPSARRPGHIYLHIPFCARRCSYCDFAIAVRKVVPVEEFLVSVERELDLRFAGGESWPVKTLYFGGGTPSRLGADGIRRLMRLFQSRVDLAPGAEITLETNPDDVTPADAEAWRASGINRISLGAQSFDDRALQWMHRVHDSSAIPRSFEVLRAAGFDDISLDLIFSLPEELKRDWQADLARAVALEPTHVSLYGLTVESHAPLGRWISRGETIEAPEESYESEFLAAHATLTAAGYEHYEVSNFAKPGRRARHNFAYWLGVPYAGLGPGAHEFAPPIRRWNVGSYVEWVRRLEQGTDPMEGSEELSDANRAAETVYLGLRTVDGLEIDPAERLHVQAWVNAGWARLVGSRLQLTALGWLRLDSLAADLTLLRSRC
ncbi:MAG TPA: radical SAM family heme chaperone HemW [Gemmatimonadaceae bacterium]|nr:radical SAM family heme chaperone HemW [Gemmatimonadaceae bacterium]